MGKFKKKRTVSLLLSAAVLLGLLGACQPVSGPDPSIPVETVLTAKELVELILPYSGCEDLEGVEYLNVDENGEQLSVYIEKAYVLTDWDDAAIIRATGASAFELAVICMENEDDAKGIEDFLKDYLHSRKGDFVGYAPEQAAMASNGEVWRTGVWLSLFICPNPEEARSAFDAALRGEILPEQPTPVPEIVATEGPVVIEKRFVMKTLLDSLLSVCQNEIDSMDGVSIESDFDSVAELAQNRYGIADDQLEMGFIVTAEDPDRYVFELVVLHIRDAADGNQIIENFTDYRKSRKRDFRELGLTDQQMIAGDGWAVREGDYVALLICQERETMVEAFRKAVREYESKEMSGEPVFTEVNWPEPEGEIDPYYPSRIKFIQPKKEDMSIYDTAAIVNAWNKHDSTSLSNYDQQIFDKAKSVLEEIIQDDMNDYDKEVAIYDWIIQNVDYDWTHTDIMEDTSKESFTPFGGLVNCKAICLGYATTFQLMMELEGINCVTIVGAAQESTEDHSWNMVQLNGNWYCVDITWDVEFWRSGMMSEKEWRFFNVTSDYMARTNHQWDYANTPEAMATDHGRN